MPFPKVPQSAPTPLNNNLGKPYTSGKPLTAIERTALFDANQAKGLAAKSAAILNLKKLNSQNPMIQNTIKRLQQEIDEMTKTRFRGN